MVFLSTMNRAVLFLSGVLASAVAALVLAAGLFMNSAGFIAKGTPQPFETWFARHVRSAAVPADAKARTNPIPDTPDVQAAARAHWADHCAGCHANDGSGDAMMGKRTWPPAPDMRMAATQDMTDGELFWIIENGVRFSAMPGWGTGNAHDEEDSWKLVRFIRHLPKQTAAETREIKGMNPRTPDEFREEQEEEKFLRGEDVTNAPQNEHHHHH